MVRKINFKTTKSWFPQRISGIQEALELLQFKEILWIRLSTPQSWSWGVHIQSEYLVKHSGP